MSDATLDQLKALVAAPPVFTPPTQQGNGGGGGHTPAQRYTGGVDPDAGFKATGFPPVPVLKDTGQIDDDGKPIFETTTLQAHVAAKGRTIGAPIQFTPPAIVTAALAQNAGAPVAQPAAPAPAAPVEFMRPPTPGAPFVPPAAAPVPAPVYRAPTGPVTLPPAAALQALTVSCVQNALSTIEMLESAGIVPAGRGLSFRQRELLEEISRVLGKLNTQ